MVEGSGRAADWVEVGFRTVKFSSSSPSTKDDTIESVIVITFPVSGSYLSSMQAWTAHSWKYSSTALPYSCLRNVMRFSYSLHLFLYHNVKFYIFLKILSLEVFYRG